MIQPTNFYLATESFEMDSYLSQIRDIVIFYHNMLRCVKLIRLIRLIHRNNYAEYVQSDFGVSSVERMPSYGSTSEPASEA